MKRISIAVLLCIIVLSCEPREVDTINIRHIWKVMSVKENGVLVFDAANLDGASRAYSRFEIDLTDANTVKMTEKGGIKVTGDWTLSRDYKKMMLTNMVATASLQAIDSSEFDIISTKGSVLMLARTTTDSKSGRILAAYTLFHK